MTKISVVSPEIDQLREHLAGRLPESVSVAWFSGADDVDHEGLDAEIVFGAPDALAPLISRMPALRWVQSTWAGVTPLMAQDRRDYTLTGVKDIFGVAMSEYVLGWLLAQERRVIGYASSRQWKVLEARSPSTLRLGIAGVGSIGAFVAQRCAPFFQEVVGLNSDGRAVAGCDRCFPMSAIADFASGLDALVMLLPHTKHTDRVVDGAVLAQLNPGATLINAGRANALDLPAVLAALESGQLAAAVLDVMDQEPLPADSPLWDAPGLYLTSHTAAPTDSGAVVRIFLENLERYLRGEPLRGANDFSRGY